ncbi:beta-ketoacyl synthase chain length factor [Aliivibrio sp. S3MY1]|uniref:beta-ketoacyl synthase chain length factor n=1 Tax=unclassified Aliivibrio TaxID=2645654 RepID=UPI00237826BE|nr:MULTISPECIES: beta-ketoacyl synthase chain length factor [unclassified Aliivibrio]MDD9195681.1 beta-ketoacyl synthase chain length factor [Aliivibrio sp. S3MY1]MDD9199104.1 beta-ketoacyl synthase chain length factor [Aliivibrio sp. S2MY1]
MAYANFNIIDWHAISAGIDTKTAWQKWQKTNFIWPEGEKAPVDKIPAMARRRMSSLSKLAVQTALTLVQEQEVDYLIFASRHGELTRTCALLEDILKGEDASPMAFSQSVHNTAAGLFTITAKKAIPVTSIAAGENTFHSALIEAAAYLSDNSDHRVLVIDFDEPLPSHYQEFEQQEYQGYAFGLILSAGDDFSLQWNNKPSIKSGVMPHGLQCISKLVGSQSQWMIESSSTQWTWTHK